MEESHDNSLLSNMALNSILSCGLVTGVEEGKREDTDKRVLCGKSLPHDTGMGVLYGPGLRV